MSERVSAVAVVVVVVGWTDGRTDGCTAARRCEEE